MYRVVVSKPNGKLTLFGDIDEFLWFPMVFEAFLDEMSHGMTEKHAGDAPRCLTAPHKTPAHKINATGLIMALAGLTMALAPMDPIGMPYRLS